MNKKFFLGIVVGIIIMIATVVILGYIYDYEPSVAQVIWPNSVKFKNVPIHEDNIFDETIIGSIPMEYFTKTHVCEIFDGEPMMVSGVFTYDFDLDKWIYCQ